MDSTNSISDINISKSANISIEVNGLLNKNLSDVLGGLNIRHSTTPDNISISYLEGAVKDQAALIGIINTLFNMRFPIVNVKIKTNEKVV
jgi:hypothetical protein